MILELPTFLTVHRSSSRSYIPCWTARFIFFERKHLEVTSMEPPAPGQTSTAPLKRALVVDADAAVTDVLGSVLKPEEWNIVHAADNQAILKLAKTGHFDLIITGAKTTGREDVDLLRKVRRVRPHVRFIILSDQSTPADVVTAMREGAFSYFSKPFAAASLTEMVRIAALEPASDDGIELLSATPEWISVIARCDQKTADRLVQFLEEISDLPDPEREDVATAFREMLLNAIEHGGNFDINVLGGIAITSVLDVIEQDLAEGGCDILPFGIRKVGNLLQELH